jgi:hypothetical protein
VPSPGSTWVDHAPHSDVDPVTGAPIITMDLAALRSSSRNWARDVVFPYGGVAALWPAPEVALILSSGAVPASLVPAGALGR